MREPMTCAQCRELIPRYHAQQFPDAQRDAVARHIAGCSACRGELTFWSAVAETLAEVEVTQRLTVNQTQVWHNVRSALSDKQGAQALQQHGGGHSMTPRPPTTTPTRSPTPTRGAGMPPASSRRPPIAALVAVALVVVLSVTLFGVVAPHLRHSTAQTGRGPQATMTPAACTPSQLRQRLPVNTELSDISMVSARDGWAVGQILDLSHPATAPQALIMHLQNCEWQQAGQTLSAAALTAVAMASPTDGWAVGTTMTSVNTGAGIAWVDDRGLLLHYHNGVWQSVTYPDSHVPADYEQIRMASPTDGWMLIYNGKVHTTPYTTAENYALYHYDGTRWRGVPMPFKTPSLNIGDLAAGPDDLWIVGVTDDSNGYSCCGIIARYHGGQWSTWSHVISNSGFDAFAAVDLTSPQNVWVFGTYNTHDSPSGQTDVALHYDGANWSQVPIAGASLVPPPFTATALPSGDAWSLTADGTVIHCTATGCQPTSFTLGGVRGDGLVDLTMFSATQGFAISGHIYGEANALLYFDDGQWSVIPSAG